MTYVNQIEKPGVNTRPASRESKQRAEKLLSLAMTNFVEPSVLRLYKVKAPLKSVSSLLFCPFDQNSASGDLQRSGGLLAADLAAGKIMQFDALNGRYYCDVVSNVEPHDMCVCSPDCLAVVDSNEWGSCVKVISVDSGRVLTTWGRQFETWTPRAITTTNEGHLVVSNIHPQASSRLTLFTPDGREISHFGRAVGPGDLVFKSPLSVASDVTSGRILAADADTSCVKIFDARCSYVTEFGNNSTSGISSSTGSGNKSATLDRPVGVCCDSRGNAIVCDSEGQRVVLFSRDGGYLCNVIDFRSANGSPGRWRPKRQQNGNGKLFPVCVGLSSPGNRIAVGLNDKGAKSSCFRKLVVCSVTPEL